MELLKLQNSQPKCLTLVQEAESGPELSLPEQSGLFRQGVGSSYLKLLIKPRLIWHKFDTNSKMSGLICTVSVWLK